MRRLDRDPRPPTDADRRRTPGSVVDRPATPDPVGRRVVLACRGCCCGTAKHPDTDHGGHVDRLRDTGLDVVETPCLGPCRRSNVYVVVDTWDPGPRGQTWFGAVLDDDAIAEVVSAARGVPARGDRIFSPPEPSRNRATALLDHWQLMR